MMRKLQCLVTGNQQQAFKTMLEYAAKIPWITFICKPVNPREARHYLQEFEIDVLFCDVATLMDKEMDFFLLNCRSKIQVIVLASKAELIDNDISCNVFSFLPKPVSFDTFYNAVLRAKDYLQPENLKETASASFFDFVFIKSEYKYYKVRFNEILFCEGMKDYTQVYLLNKPKPIITLQNLKTLVSKLPPADFIRVHRSYVVSLSSIDVVSKTDIVIGQKFIPIGESYRSNLFKIVEQAS
jgi:DNA-binding LytR/AlgR family response regulator